MDRLEERYDNVKAPETVGKGQNARERGKRGVALEFGETVPWVLGKWSHFQPNVEKEPPRVGLIYKTQKQFTEKIRSWEKMAAWRIALGFGG